MVVHAARPCQPPESGDRRCRRVAAAGVGGVSSDSDRDRAWWRGV